jgi:SAM-dependent methyltransferase
VPNIQERAERLNRHEFFGVPIPQFEEAGRQQFILLLMAGLQPHSKVLDIGCGVLRAGYWLIHFLDPGCYFGIEPHQGRLETGMTAILEPDLALHKKPRLDHNDTFDTGVFGEKFDFFLAYSIWTHASKPQIEVMLDNFVRDSSPNGLFLASVLPARTLGRDYDGSSWFGTSHESNVAGCIRHSLRWIEQQCRLRGLRIRSLGRERHGQTWLAISRGSGSPLQFRTIWAESLPVRAMRRLFRR